MDAGTWTLIALIVWAGLMLVLIVGGMVYLVRVIFGKKRSSPFKDWAKRAEIDARLDGDLVCPCCGAGSRYVRIVFNGRAKCLQCLADFEVKEVVDD